MNRKKRNALRLFALLFFVIFAGGLLLIRARLYPLIDDMAQTRVNNVASGVINNAIEEQILSGGVDYDTMVMLEKDADGNITALKTNMAVMNRLKTEILNILGKKIPEMTVSQIGIPIGNLIFPELFSGRGFYLPVKILSVQSSDASFQNRFSQAGINQTLHQVIMNVALKMTVLTPAGAENVTCSSQVVVAETVIVGTVPNSYVEVQTQKATEE